MKLGSKLLFSYSIVILVAVLSLAISMTFVARATFARQVYRMQMDEEHLQSMGMTHGQGPGGGMVLAPRFFEELQLNFRRSVNTALILSGLAAVAVAAVASYSFTRQIVKPIQQVAAASNRIADGHYDERLERQAEGDELDELVSSFNLMAQALDDTERMRQQLIADVSHELKTPLSSIKGYMEGLQDGVVAPTNETYALVHREASRLQRLVRDLQELSRAEAAQLEMEFALVDPAELVTAAVTWLQPQFDDKRVTLVTDIPGDLPEIRADADRVRQVLSNILGNALQYTPEQGTVTVSLAREDGYVRFAVRDDGVGLSEDDLKLVFQRFYRVDKSRARASGGSGIGLTIARHIVEGHGGQIRAQSAGVGQGSTFMFTIPTVSDQ